MLSKRQDYYASVASDKACARYQPCPICYKCTVKASHIFLECANCPIPIDSHPEKARVYMIRRENFRHPLLPWLKGTVTT